MEGAIASYLDREAANDQGRLYISVLRKLLDHAMDLYRQLPCGSEDQNVGRCHLPLRSEGEELLKHMRTSTVSTASIMLEVWMDD